MSKDELEPYVLRFDGRIPAVRYYLTREKGIKARHKYRKQGYHVQLHKIQLPREVTDAKTKPSKPRRDNNNFLTRIADRFRRRSNRKAI